MPLRQQIRIMLAVIGGLAILTLYQIAINLPPSNKTSPETDTIGPQISLEINGVQIKAEIADEPEKQRRGLSGRSSLGAEEGMLFIFPQETVPSFWMKEMNFPIDIIWINKEKTVIGISANIQPETFPQIFSPPEPILYVLEVNAGQAEQWGIKNEDSIISTEL